MAPEFRVLDHLLVTPAAADGNAGACSVPLTFFDVKWLHLPPVERVLFYRLTKEADAATLMISALKESLPHALRAFYPLAGHVRLAPGRSDRHELLYQPGDGVAFTTAEYDADVDELATDDPVHVSSISPLVPRLPKGRAVLALQATVLRRGVALGVTIHHSACDGRSSTHFLHTWAALALAGDDDDARARLQIDPPVIDRSLVPDPRGLYDTYLQGMPPVTRSEELEFTASNQPPPADVAMATFTLSEEVLQGIKGALAGEAARRGRGLSPRCSSLVAAYSFMWWCHCHCRAASSSKENYCHYFLFSVDQRARLKPAIPDRYMGNCMCPAIAKVPRDEMTAGGDGLYAACAAVVAAIEEEVGEGARDRWDGCVARVKEAVANGTLSVAGSPTFRVYDIDFGFGRPAKVHIVSVAKTGAISVAESRGGGRAVEIGVSLPQDTMDRFRKCFLDAVEWLSPARK
jgi:hypothetical protein